MASLSPGSMEPQLSPDPNSAEARACERIVDIDHPEYWVIEIVEEDEIDLDKLKHWLKG